MSSLLDAVEILDGGEKMILTSKDEDALRIAAAQLVADGAQNMTPVAKVGQKWICSFSHPDYLSCSIETFGYEVIVSGPSQEAVLSRARECKERGCIHVRGPQLIDGVWKLYLEDVGKRTGTQVTL